MKTTLLKGKFSVIYNVLLDHHSSSFTPLKNIWQRDLGCDFGEEQWNIICQNTFTSLSCNKVIEQNYKLIHRTNFTLLHLRKMFPSSSPRCHRCKTYRINYARFLGMQKIKAFLKGCT